MPRRAACRAATCRSSSSAARSCSSPKVLVVAQPTWGVDVGAAAFIRQRIIDLRNDGVAVLVLSEELDELFEICDRIAVIAQGRLSPPKAVRDTSVEEIGLWMSGMWPGAAAGRAPASRRGGGRCAIGLRRGPQPSRLMGYLSPLLAAVLTLLAGFVLFSLLGKDPLTAFHTFFIHPVSDLQRRRGAAAEGVAADDHRRRARVRLPGQCLEHRRRRAADPRRHLRGRRRAAFPRVAEPAGAAADAASPAWSAACCGRRSRRCCAPASTPTRSWSA